MKTESHCTRQFLRLILVTFVVAGCVDGYNKIAGALHLGASGQVRGAVIDQSFDLTPYPHVLWPPLPTGCRRVGTVRVTGPVAGLDTELAPTLLEQAKLIGGNNVALINPASHDYLSQKDFADIQFPWQDRATIYAAALRC